MLKKQEKTILYNNNNINTKIPDINITSLENFLLGGIAAVTSKTFAAPIERIKLLIQNESELIVSGRLTIKYRGPFDCFKRVINDEGIISLWRGNLTNCLRYFPTQALNFMFKERISNIIGNKDLLHNILSGGIGGMLSLTFTYVLDYSRTRLSNDIIFNNNINNNKRQFNGLIDVIKKTYKSDGIKGLYRGYSISLGTVFVYRGIYFGFYDTLKPTLKEYKDNFFINFSLGYTITMFAGLCVYPVDTLRRRMMMKSGELIKYNNSYHALKNILNNEGIGALYKGCFINVIRGVAGAGIYTLIHINTVLHIKIIIQYIGTLAGFDLFKREYIRYRLNYF